MGKNDPHRHARLQAVDDEVVLLRLQRLGIRLADLEFDPDRLAFVEPEHVQHARRRHGFKPEPAHALESFAQVQPQMSLRLHGRTTRPSVSTKEHRALILPNVRPRSFTISNAIMPA